MRTSKFDTLLPGMNPLIQGDHAGKPFRRLFITCGPMFPRCASGVHKRLWANRFRTLLSFVGLQLGPMRAEYPDIRPETIRCCQTNANQSRSARPSLASGWEQVTRCCQTNANPFPFALPRPGVRPRAGRASRRERRRGSFCRCCDLGDGAPLGSGCGPRHGLRRTSAAFACAGTAAWPALVVGTADGSSRRGY